MRKYFIISSICLFLFSACESTKQVTSLQKELEWLKGEWIGVGFQMDAVNQATWKIELDVDMKNKACKINYPSLECGGHWKLQKGNPYTATFTENITKGKDKCYNGGRLVITKIDNNHLSYSFFYPDSGKLGAFSTLVKKEHFIQQHSTTL